MAEIPVPRAATVGRHAPHGGTCRHPSRDRPDHPSSMPYPDTSRHPGDRPALSLPGHPDPVHRPPRGPHPRACRPGNCVRNSAPSIRRRTMSGYVSIRICRWCVRASRPKPRSGRCRCMRSPKDHPHPEQEPYRPPPPRARPTPHRIGEPQVSPLWNADRAGGGRGGRRPPRRRRSRLGGLRGARTRGTGLLILAKRARWSTAGLRVAVLRWGFGWLSVLRVCGLWRCGSGGPGRGWRRRGR